ncbi:MAG: hypothetical protein EZS28_013725 [Streblomastix strix]|uniref:Uncharacterized protein n=1 Tax=Streblomastix strix TaxID=222440 RepID=A0A5J4W7B6_9EUKA|nr:MAG: hypothetical protein EZS28_013725 [Streblomastix strix]
MEEESILLSKSTSEVSKSTNSSIVNVSHLVTAIKSSDMNIQIPALKRILDIVLKEPESIENIYSNDVICELNKFIANEREGEIYVLSSTILHIIGIRSKEIAVKIRVRAETEKLSLSRSEALADLIEKNNALKIENTKLKEEIVKIKFEYPQVIPHEFNVIGGLLGLGPDILLEILSDLLISDSIQFLCVCKKTNRLMKHARFYRIIETLTKRIEIMNKDPADIELVDIDCVQKKIIKKKIGFVTTALTQVLVDGFWSIEAIFQNTEITGAAIGIVRDSYDIPAKASYSSKPHTDHIAAFSNESRGKPVWYKGLGTYGNSKFKDNQILRLEFDSYKETLILFIDNVQQPVYFQGINEKVRFIV